MIKWRASSFSHDPFSLSLHSFPSCMPPSSVDKLTPTPLVRLSSMALIANIGLTIRAFRHRALLPHRGNLRSAHAARLTSFHCRLRCSAFFQVTLVAQILLPPICSLLSTSRRRQGAATPTSLPLACKRSLLSFNIECTNPCLCAIYSCTSILRRSFYRR